MLKKPLPMGARKGRRTGALDDSIVGQHLSLPYAAGLARNQLVADAACASDGEHRSRTLNLVACAIAKVVPLYTADSGGPRELTQVELADAEVCLGATLLSLKDGRRFSTVSIKRADLRQAIAVLKTAGVPGITPASSPEPSSGKAAPPRNGELPARLAELEELLDTSPLQPPQIALAGRLAMTIARRATTGVVANLAMKLMSALHDRERERVRVVLEQLRRAVDEQEKVTWPVDSADVSTQGRWK